MFHKVYLFVNGFFDSTHVFSSRPEAVAFRHGVKAAAEVFKLRTLELHACIIPGDEEALQREPADQVRRALGHAAEG